MGWMRARKKARLPRDLLLICARHDRARHHFDMEMVGRTGNLKAIMEVIRHSASPSSGKLPIHPLPL